MFYTGMHGTGQSKKLRKVGVKQQN